MEDCDVVDGVLCTMVIEKKEREGVLSYFRSGLTLALLSQGKRNHIINLFLQDKNTLFQIQGEKPKSNPFRYKSPTKTSSFGPAGTSVHDSLY